MARVWRRHRTADTPRPAGRRWARLRRSGSRATQLLARVARRRRKPTTASSTGTQVVFSDAERQAQARSRRRGGSRRSASSTVPAGTPLSPVTPVSPALPPQLRQRDARVRRASLTGGPTTIALLPGERTRSRRIKFAVTNGCTVASMLFGMAGAFLAIHGELQLAAAALLCCVVLDGCDGALARRFGVGSPFGAQMDSLADLSSFGVATGVVVYQWLVAQGASTFAAAPATALVAVCAAVRLARFNISPKDGRFFSGVPTTMTAAVLALNILLGPQLPPAVQVAFVAVYAVAMVTPFPYAKLAFVLRLPLWLWVFPAICAMISVPGAFLAVVGGYLVSGVLLWVVPRRQPALR